MGGALMAPPMTDGSKKSPCQIGLRVNALTELALGLRRIFSEFQRQGILRSMLPSYCVNPCAVPTFATAVKEIMASVR